MLTNYWSVSKTAETDPSRPIPRPQCQVQDQNCKIPVLGSLKTNTNLKYYMSASYCLFNAMPGSALANLTFRLLRSKKNARPIKI